MTNLPPNPAIALWLQSDALVGRVQTALLDSQCKMAQMETDLAKAVADLNSQIAKLKAPAVPRWGSQPRIKGRMER